MLSARSRLIALSQQSEGDSEDGITFTTSVQDKEAKEEAKRERRRRKLERELFETEQAYIYHLEVIHKYFDFPLRFACIIPEDVHSRIFGNVEQILEVNRKLIDYMEQTTVGQAFHQIGPFLKLYSTYANGHEQALSVLQEWKQKKSEFSEYIKTQEARAEMKGLTLNALLITPVQRIPRYKLLLEDLLAHTPKDHHDYQHLHDATTQIADIAMHINEHIRQHENFQKMLSIQKSFDQSAPKILTPGRQFIREGILKKVARRTGKAQERMFFLFSDVLLYGKARLLDSGKKTYSCCCVLPLKHCHVEPVFITNLPKLDSGGMFMISCKDECLLLYSDDVENAKSWTADFNKAITKLCTDRKTLRKPSSNKIPLKGKSLRRKTRQDKKEEQAFKNIKHHAVRGSVVNCSPVIEKLEPYCEQLVSDLSNCLTPVKHRHAPDENCDPSNAVFSKLMLEKECCDNLTEVTDSDMCDVFSPLDDITQYPAQYQTRDTPLSHDSSVGLPCETRCDAVTSSSPHCDDVVRCSEVSSPSLHTEVMSLPSCMQVSSLPPSKARTTWKSPHRLRSTHRPSHRPSLMSCLQKPISRILRSRKHTQSSCMSLRKSHLLSRVFKK